jgi:uncharacterized protein YnzC (UPF0291/DUF896 family)
LTETISSEEVAVCTDAVPSNEKIAERKTIVYETRIDPTVIKMAGEKLKDQLFIRYGFLKPKPNEIQFVAIDKYYEPYMVISGKYCIDYYRKCAYTVNVNKDVLEVILLDHKFVSEQEMDRSAPDHNAIKLQGEERLKIDAKASVILDKTGQDVTLEKLPSAPSEKNPKKTLAAFGVEEIAPDTDVKMIRSRVVTRPNDIKRLVNELFEVDERAIIYTPRFKVTFCNIKTGEQRTVEFDGVTAEKLKETKAKNPSDLPLPPPPP